jgi:hypothetical protein
MAKLLKIDPLRLRIELFRRKAFNFITVLNGKKHKKQEEALKILTDKVTRILIYGGAAGGAKSWTGCSWLIGVCLLYPGTRWFVGRKELKQLRDSTLMTFYKVAKTWKLERGRKADYWFNGQDNYIEFANGSRIDFLDLGYEPQDPFFERLGSFEFTGGWIEEAGEIPFAAFDVLASRVNRHMNDFYGLVGKIFVTCNPKKNWLYSFFYKPWRRGELNPDEVFLQALVDDNPHNEQDYKKSLERIRDGIKRQRLLLGNWEYDDDPSSIFSVDKINDLRTNPVDEGEKRYIIVDAARLGRDKSAIQIWYGMVCKFTHTLEKSRLNELEGLIINLAKQHRVPMSQVIVDEMGLGSGVVDTLGCKGFNSASKAILSEEDQDRLDAGDPALNNFQNLRAQCYYVLSEMVANSEIKIEMDSESDWGLLEEELQHTKVKNPDSDKKIAIISKEDIKKEIGRSPDLADCLMMRVLPELEINNEPGIWIID